MYTIEINKNDGEGLRFIVGCEFCDEKLAKQIFQEISRVYGKKPHYDERDYLIDLYYNEDLVKTVVTDAQGAKKIGERYFK